MSYKVEKEQIRDYDEDLAWSMDENIRKMLDPVYKNLFTQHGLGLDIKVRPIRFGKDEIHTSLQYAGIDFIVENEFTFFVQEKFRDWSGENPMFVVEVYEDVFYRVKEGWVKKLKSDILSFVFLNKKARKFSYQPEKSIFLFDAQKIKSWFKSLKQDEELDIEHIRGEIRKRLENKDVKRGFWSNSNLIDKNGRKFRIMINQPTVKKYDGYKIKHVSAFIFIPIKYSEWNKFEFFEAILPKYLKGE